jgi:leucyl/phenylalanyl-tRNA--protein transferase
MAEAAYREGVFPMGEARLGVITWHRPDPRAIIPLDGFHTSRSLRKKLRKDLFEITYDKDFAGVMTGCAEGRPVWISPKIQETYLELHRRGKAHSVEVWQHGTLVGGVYGVHLGAAFMAESKFHRVTDASKVALFHLVRRLNQRSFDVLEVQYMTDHLMQFGTVEISLREYLAQLKRSLRKDCTFA